MPARGGSNAEALAAFHEVYVCRISIFGFLDLKKDHRQRREFASLEFKPAWSEPGQPRYERFEVSATLRSQDAGAMETSRGIGVAVIVERRPGKKAANAQPAWLLIDDVLLEFNARPRNEDVTV